MPALLALIAVTAVWGYTFVPMKDAVAIYPLFAFLAVRFLIASVVLAVPAAGRMRSLGRRGWGADARLERGLHLRPLRRLHAVARPAALPHACRPRRLARCRARGRRAGDALRCRLRQPAR